jgi:predicted RNA-binding protein with EMAP domain
MMHETPKDPRIILAELAVDMLRKYTEVKLGIKPGLSKDETRALLKQIDSDIMTLKYMYVPPMELVGQDPCKEIVVLGNKIREAYSDAFKKKKTPPLAKATLIWSLNILTGLPHRFLNNGKTIVAGVDIKAVKIRNAVQKGKLTITKVNDGNREMTIVTNLKKISSGNILGAAMLPPIEIAGTVSEAMFLGNEPREEAPGTFLHESEFDTKEAEMVLNKTMK